MKRLEVGDLKTGLWIIERNHPDYGFLKVINMERKGLWEVRYAGSQGDKLLSESEVKYYDYVGDYDEVVRLRRSGKFQ